MASHCSWSAKIKLILARTPALSPTLTPSGGDPAPLRLRRSRSRSTNVYSRGAPSNTMPTMEGSAMGTGHGAQDSAYDDSG
eukprot:scaffold647_cov411-Prasinococcus_capsulatus_cf.AAC.9